MGISGISSTNNMAVMQMTATDLKDQKTKNIQNEITDVQQQLQKLSSEEGLSANEKADERKKLQKEVSSLNTELKHHQDELIRSHKREILLAQLQEDKDPAKEEKSEDKIRSKETSSETENPQKFPDDKPQTAQPGTVIAQSSDGTVILKEVLNPVKNENTGTEKEPVDDTKEKAVVAEETKTSDNDTVTDAKADKEMQAMVSADASLQQADRQGTIITKLKDGIAILKGEIKQDKYRGINTERKQDEVQKLQRQSQRAMAFQFAVLGEADNAMAEIGGSVKNKTQADTENTLYISGLNVPQKEHAAQERFHVAIG